MCGVCGGEAVPSCASFHPAVYLSIHSAIPETALRGRAGRAGPTAPTAATAAKAASTAAAAASSVSTSNAIVAAFAPTRQQEDACSPGMRAGSP